MTLFLPLCVATYIFFFFSSRRRHTRYIGDWSSDVCSSDLAGWLVGIYQLTTNHPARIAERTASLDLLSNGRVELGMGESASITELEPFGVNMDNKREIFEEAVRALIPMFKDGPTEHHGKHFDMPLRTVIPKP